MHSIVGQDRRGRFDVVMAGDDVPRKKPDPIIYQMASERVQVPPERCVVIEDSLVGLRAAKGAGMKCIITYTESTKDEDFYGEGADAVVADLSKVADLICLICLICVRLPWYAGSCNDVLVPSGTVDAACGNGPAPPAREFASSSASSAPLFFLRRRTDKSGGVQVDLDAIFQPLMSGAADPWAAWKLAPAAKK